MMPCVESGYGRREKKEKENALRDRGLSAFLKKGGKGERNGASCPRFLCKKKGPGERPPIKFREFPLGRKGGCDDSLLPWSEVVGGLCRFRLCWNSDLLLDFLSTFLHRRRITQFPSSL